MSSSTAARSLCCARCERSISAPTNPAVNTLVQRPTRARSAALCALFALLALPASVRAQSANGWALDRYEPASAGDPFFVAEHPWYSRTRRFSLGTTVDFTRNPLVLRAPMSQPQVVIDNMVLLHVHAAVALFDRVAITASLPVSLTQTAGPSSGSAAASGLSAYAAGPALGDPRLGARVRIFGQSDESYFSLHVGGQLFFGVIPWSGDEHWVTDEAMRGRAYLTGAGRVGPMRYSLSAGYHFRRPAQLARQVIDGDVFVTAGLALVALDGKLHVGPEFWANIVPASFGVANVDPTVNAEATLGINYVLANALSLGIAGGPGLASSAGSPTFRGLVRVAYTPFSAETAPAPRDDDRDGVPDDDDQCPGEASGERSDPARRGCPAPRLDRDGDGVLDDQDLCPEEEPSSMRDRARTGCNLPDQDHDGVADHDDQCVDQPRGEHEDGARAGCPDGDEDGDGVRNGEDQCRDAAQGAVADPARVGCAAPDSDGDTVQDPVDRCVDRPGIPQPNTDEHGCPTALVGFDGRALIVTGPVDFVANRDTLTAASNATLDAVAAAINALPERVRVIDVQAHEADNVPRDRAVNLTQRRADAVRAYLAAHGVTANRLQSHGMGASAPRVDPQGLRGAALTRARGQNRRVEFVVIDPAPAAR